VIASLSVDCAAHGVTDETLVHGIGLYFGVYFQAGIKRLFGVTISDKLNATKQASTPDVTDMGVITESLL
jgi:hypothetical protein